MRSTHSVVLNRLTRIQALGDGATARVAHAEERAQNESHTTPRRRGQSASLAGAGVPGARPALTAVYIALSLSRTNSFFHLPISEPL